MGEPAKKITSEHQPIRLKISSKRQITIPSQVYKELGFKEYALCTWTDSGMTIEPIGVKDEDTSVALLRGLIAQGYEGDELLEMYEVEYKKITRFDAKVMAGYNQMLNGQVGDMDKLLENLKDDYGF